MSREESENNKPYIDMLDIEWGHYDREFISYIVRRKQIALLSSLSEIIYSDFPINMPKEVMTPVLAKYYLAFEDSAQQKNMPTYLSEVEFQRLREMADTELDERQERLLFLYYGIQFESRFFLDLPVMEFPDFDGMRKAQEVITTYSYAEGFITDSIKMILDLDEKYKDFDKQEKEKLLFELLFGNIETKISKINRKLNLKITLSDKQRVKHKKLNCLRNLIVHNNACANLQYIKLFEDKRTKLGEKIPMTDKMIEELLDSLGEILYLLYREISLKYLGRAEDKLLPMPRITEMHEQ
jgi:hypothetical protein